MPCVPRLLLSFVQHLFIFRFTQISCTTPHNQNSSPASTRGSTEFRNGEHCEAEKICRQYLVCIRVLFAYCTLVVSIISRPSTTLVGFFLYTWTLVFQNSCLNPVIYCWKMRHIRHAVMNVLRNIFASQN